LTSFVLPNNKEYLSEVSSDRVNSTSTDENTEIISATVSSAKIFCVSTDGVTFASITFAIFTGAA
jgi:hypothetical protein